MFLFKHIKVSYNEKIFKSKMNSLNDQLGVQC